MPAMRAEGALDGRGNDAQHLAGMLGAIVATLRL